jgi:hypothetical protein
MFWYMPRAPHHPDSVTTPVQVTARGITPADVDRAADSLLRAGQRPTIEKVRAKIGRGSPNTINPLLDAWWQRLAGRLDAGPAALHRLPEPVLLAAEGLWLQTLDEARKRATAEQGSRKASLARDAQEIDLRAHVLSIRESELRDRIAHAEGRASQLAIEIEALTTLLRKEQASRLAVERRLAAAQSELQRPQTRVPRRRASAKAPPARKAKSRKPATKTARARPAAARTVSRPQRRTRRVAQ